MSCIRDPFIVIRDTIVLPFSSVPPKHVLVAHRKNLTYGSNIADHRTLCSLKLVTLLDSCDDEA